jgi:hypothetical protein
MNQASLFDPAIRFADTGASSRPSRMVWFLEEAMESAVRVDWLGRRCYPASTGPGAGSTPLGSRTCAAQFQLVMRRGMRLCSAEVHHEDGESRAAFAPIAAHSSAKRPARFFDVPPGVRKIHLPPATYTSNS